jgi:glucose/arabinose dehydrogenase
MALRAPAALAAAALILAAGVVAGCGDDGDEGTTGAEQTAAQPPAAAGVQLEPIGGEFDAPVYVTQPPGEDSDLYVVEQPGRVQIVRDGKQLPEPFLDISEQVTSDGEQGFLSIAFAPDYEESGLLYGYYTGKDGNQNVVEFKRSGGNPDTADPASEREVLKMEDFAANHNGGLLVFGPGDLLYIGTGDGGGAGDPRRNAQDPGSLLGKILRLDPRTAGADPEIFALGLRNPWRFSFDSETGDLFIGDVGQSEFEEIDIVAAAQAEGANFGWSAFEGEQRFNDDQEAPGAIPPALVYPHQGKNSGCSVNGGYVVRDPEVPALDGRYVYSDFCSGAIRSFRPEGTTATDDKPTGLETEAPSSFGIDNAGHIYVTTLNGEVLRIAAK